MATSHFKLPSVATSLVLLFIICFLPNIRSQTTENSSTSPTVSECGPRLLPLAPCGPFVQGTSPTPTQACCANLRQLFARELSCLCFMVNDSSMSSFPINRTLALQLPELCNLRGGLSTCSVGGLPVTLPPSSPTSQISFGTKSNATVAASPMVTVSPKSSGLMGFLPHSRAKLNAVNHLVVALIAEMILFGTTYSFESWSIMFLTI